MVWDFPSMAEKGPVEFLPKVAKLPSLCDLSIIYYSFSGGILMDQEQVTYALHDLLLNGLDLYFYDKDNFKALKKLSVFVGLRVCARFKLAVFKELMEESLPSVFDPAIGRVATAGLNAKVEPDFYPLPQEDALPDEWF